MSKMSEAYDVLGDIFSSIIEMQKKKKVDLAIIPKFNSLAKQCSNLEEFWVTQDIPLNIAFSAFHAARNSRMILNKMIERFREHNRNENPRIVSAAEGLIPILYEVFSRLKKARESLPKIELDVSRQLFDTTRKLRKTAHVLSMLPSLEDEMQCVNREALTKEFQALRREWMLEVLEM